MTLPAVNQPMGQAYNTQPNQPMMNQAAPAPTNPAPASDGSKKRMMMFVVVGLIAVILVGFAVYMYLGQSNGDSVSVLGATSENSATDEGYVAVFVEGGQVYFGMLKSKTATEMVLSDTYFLQVSTVPVQDGEEAQQEAQTELTLVRRTQSLHSPDGTIILNPEKVLFTEKLLPGSKVLEAIHKLQEEEMNGQNGAGEQQQQVTP